MKKGVCPYFRILVFGIYLVVFGFGILSAQDTSEQLLRKASRVSELVELLDAADEDIKEAAFKELLTMGRDALPFIEDKLRQRGGGTYLALLKTIYTEGLFPEDKKKVSVPILPTRPTKNDVDKYVYAKYAEAVMLFDKKEYQRAGDIVEALLVLEPDSPYKDYLEKLNAVCEQKRWQDSLVKATVTPDKEFYEEGDVPKITFCLKNVSDRKLTILSAGDKGKGYILLQTKLTFYDPLGATTTFEANDTIGIEPELVLAIGENWEKKYSIPPATQMEGNFIRVYEISAKILPQKIQSGLQDYFKKINFDGGVVRIYPSGSKKFVEGGVLKRLGEAIDNGTLEDVFICAMLLGEGEKEAGMEILMRALKSVVSTSPAEQMILNCLKHLTGLPYGQDKNAWLKWWSQRGK